MKHARLWIWPVGLKDYGTGMWRARRQTQPSISSNARRYCARDASIKVCPAPLTDCSNSR
jgi:hypothetical protein